MQYTMNDRQKKCHHQHHQFQHSDHHQLRTGHYGLTTTKAVRSRISCRTAVKCKVV